MYLDYLTVKPEVQLTWHLEIKFSLTKTITSTLRKSGINFRVLNSDITAMFPSSSDLV